MATSPWTAVEEEELAQGNFLPKCLVPWLPDDFDPTLLNDGDEAPLQLQEFDLIVVTQSCDLVQGKTRKVALCPVHSLSAREKFEPGFTRRTLPDVQKGRKYGLHYLPPIPGITGEDPVIVDFREIHSLAFSYVLKHALRQEQRWSLNSPYLENFSKAFGDLFSRVALP